ncbi:MAG TPA: phosphate regulon sensor histidine kinase PhoR [Ramlibacter sp.]|uniref:phosphate regulon sensor histidine kinase PhoR n=1 Tax=Ramlibacter sp. TaxID=1917967 RepID=UPI002B8DFF30|nr:phosphate regulon sensor histidine kinase PhoR [Ramlibacter sp.]HVZ43109.1 phosphate regulon sensor histidine kinase PhoR [Ramlibacter sp.]
MIGRAVTFVACLVAGAFIGLFAAGDAGLTVGLGLGCLAWFLLETLRAARVLRWLRRGGDAANVPDVGGAWGEALDRTRRALRLRERETAEARKRLEDFLSALQASPSGVILLDADGRIEWCNQTASDQFGLDAQRDHLQHIAHLVRDPSFTAYFQGRSYAQEVVITGPGSTALRPVKLSAQMHPYGGGRHLLLSRDITAVEQAEIMRRDFVANVSHEIRTPLTVLTGFIETLQSLDLPADERGRYLELMAKQAQRMQTLVSDLLTLSRLEGSPLPGAGEWTPLAMLMAQCEQEARALSVLLGRSQSLHFAPPPPVELAGSSTELMSAISNLVSNAIRYTPSSGTVHVQWRQLGDGRLEFSVRDTGPGIAIEHIPRLTERFYRVDRSRSRETGGTGLGLAIVKHVVQRHGAELRVESALGTGSTFAIVFPSARLRPAAAPAQASIAA